MAETIRSNELDARHQAPEAGSQGNGHPAVDSPRQLEPATTIAERGKKQPKPDKPKAHQLRPKESFRKGIKRIVRHELDKALDQAKRFPSPDGQKEGEERQDKADVHDIRKRFKRIRAVLRLVRSEMGEAAYHEGNATIRDVGLMLSEVRNSKVVLEALDSLRDRSSRDAANDFDVVARYLRARQWDLREQLMQNQRQLDQLRSAIKKIRKCVPDWSLARGARRAARDGLKDAYRQASRAFQAAETDPTDEHLHECRKRAKYFYHELQVVAFIGAASPKELEQGFHELEQTLGEDHDLAMLRREAMACEKGGLTTDGSNLIARIDIRRREVQRHAMRLGRRVFQAKEKAVRRQLSAWLKKGR